MIVASSANATGEQIDDVRASNWLNSGAFIGLAIGSGLCTCIAGFSIGKAGERIAKRLRLQVFNVKRLHNCVSKKAFVGLQKLLYEDGAFFDRPQNAIATLTSRLARDAPNVQNAIDQRLKDVLQVGFKYIKAKRR